MAKKPTVSKITVPQSYPRITDESDKYYGFLDDNKLFQHVFKIPIEDLNKIIADSVKNANIKSSRTILKVPEEISKEEEKKLYKKEGKKLFAYFLKYCGDPASTAHQCLNIPCSKVAYEQFKNRTLQKQRMNSGWRYQYIAKGTANSSKRFLSVSDLGGKEEDFNATIAIIDSKNQLNIYVSVKNRTNTMGGQDWPKAIHALEAAANNDKNRVGPFLCIFGIAMEKGLRVIKRKQKSKEAYSYNTEVWKSDFFWPFFSNYSYDEIVKSVLDVLLEINEQDKVDIELPQELLDSFCLCCREHGLLDENDNFNDAYKLLDLFCGKKVAPAIKKLAQEIKD